MEDMTTGETILAATLALNIIGTLWLWRNHQFSAKADRKELFRRMRKVELNVARIMTRLEMKDEDET